MLGARPVVHRPTREMSPVQALVSRISALVPLYDFATAKQYAERLLYAQVVLCVFAALSWAFGGVAHLSFGMAILALVAFEVGSARLLKMYAVSQVGLWFVDVLWLALWAHRIDQGKVRPEFAPIPPNHRPAQPSTARSPPPLPLQDLVFHATVAAVSEGKSSNVYHGAPRFLLAMQCFMFILRPLQIWCGPRWDLDFGGAAGAGRRRALRPTRRRSDASPRTVPVTVDGVSAGPYSGGGTHIVGGDADGYRPSILPDATGAPNNPAAARVQPPSVIAARGPRPTTERAERPNAACPVAVASTRCERDVDRSGPAVASRRARM